MRARTAALIILQPSRRTPPSYCEYSAGPRGFDIPAAARLPRLAVPFYRHCPSHVERALGRRDGSIGAAWIAGAPRRCDQRRHRRRQGTAGHAVVCFDTFRRRSGDATAQEALRQAPVIGNTLDCDGYEHCTCLRKDWLPACVGPREMKGCPQCVVCWQEHGAARGSVEQARCDGSVFDRRACRCDQGQQSRVRHANGSTESTIRRL